MAVKTDNPNMGRPVGNKHKVGRGTWDRWSNAAKRTFNYTYEGMRNQADMTDPGTPLMSRSQWTAVRWNAALIAAAAVDGRRM